MKNKFILNTELVVFGDRCEKRVRDDFKFFGQNIWTDGVAIY